MNRDNELLSMILDLRYSEDPETKKTIKENIMKLRNGSWKPFGAAGHNGLNFASSVNDENSLLCKVITYLRMCDGVDVSVTKRMIVENVMGLEVVNYNIPCNYFETKKIIGKNTLRGYHSNFFRIAVSCGFLKHKRVGKTVLWSLGPKGERLFR